MFQEIINDFTAETGIQVDLITPGSEGEAQLKTMMASNSLPDVWMTHGWSLLRYSEYLKVVNDQPRTLSLALWPTKTATSTRSACP